MISKPFMAEAPTSPLVKCNGCIECCTSGGTIQILSNEVERLQNIGVPIIKYKNHHFVERHRGACPMLDLKNGRCTIYYDRPLSCKLFPFDIQKRIKDKAHWVLYNFCPKEQLVYSKPTAAMPSELFLARAIAARLEDEIPIDILREFAESDAIVSGIDMFEPHRTHLRVLGPVGKLVNTCCE